MAEKVWRFATLSAKGSSDSMSFLIGMLCLAIVIGFALIITNVFKESQEEQRFLESFRDLAYAMDYVCATGNPQEVEVYLPQSVGIPQNWIATYADPKYIIYFERFPPLEEWSWTALRMLTPLGVFSGEEVAKLEPFITGSENNLKKTLEIYASEGGIISDIAARTVSGDTAPRIIYLNAMRLSPFAMEEKAKTAVTYLTGARDASIKGKAIGNLGNEAIVLMKRIDKHIPYIIPPTPADISDDELFRKISLESFTYIEEMQKDLAAIADSYPSSADKQKLQEILLMSENSFLEETRLEKLLDYIKKSGISSSEVDKYTKTIENLLNFIKTGQSITGFKAAAEDVKAFYAGAGSVLRNMDFNVIPRGIILSDIGGYGAWDQGTYIFSSGLSYLERSRLKYQFCGKDTLCAKTRNYIVTYELTRCKNKGIDFVGLRKTADEGFNSPIGEFASWSANSRARFYLASPCKQKVEIKKETCECYSLNEDIYQLLYVPTSQNTVKFSLTSPGAASLGSEICLEGEKDILHDCLMVYPPMPGESKPLGGFHAFPEDNFCYSKNKRLYEFSQTGMVGAAFATLEGVARLFMSGDTTIGVTILSDIFFNQGRGVVSSVLLWPN